MRVIIDGDPDNVQHRVALIEKTPRVRIRSGHYGTEVEWDEQGNMHTTRTWPEFLDWCEGPSGDGPDDEMARAWCDTMLRTLGYTF